MEKKKRVVEKYFLMHFLKLQVKDIFVKMMMKEAKLPCTTFAVRYAMRRYSLPKKIQWGVF